MFLGHFGVGFFAKGHAPRASLGTLFLAAQFIDLLWPTLPVLGWSASLSHRARRTPEPPLGTAAQHAFTKPAA